MACSNSSMKDNIEEESEITRCGRENIERRAILDNIDNKLREFDLFDMNHNVISDPRAQIKVSFPPPTYTHISLLSEDLKSALQNTNRSSNLD
ncbi:hypothetical protein Anas_03803 [Armadillidium nasatum]|uniref:Uncharacterized protein n=1 Tax=Armadillidium nasatum TaxID=96803 RepID=A0A5N5TI41_9CRUS|nr:hypothetical protein Anas_03803 [Armadillidium nasatum]